MAPNPNRSLLPSSSSESNAKRENVVKKKFACSFSGCGKCFSRSEHLQRHALNHKDGDNTCLRCMTHFRRRDLLDRHMARHKEKDDKAGGEGLGFLATRKKLYKNAEGKIVNARRPLCEYELVKRRQFCRSKKKETKPKSLLEYGSLVTSDCLLGLPNQQKVDELSKSSWQEIAALPSPPTSDVDPEAFRSNFRDVVIENTENLYYDQWSGVSQCQPEIYSPQIILARHPEYVSSPVWASHQFQTFMGAVGETTSEDLFRIETGLYDWQSWNNQVIMSRCRDERDDGLEEKRRQWPPNLAHHGGVIRKGHCLNSC
ncbi:Nicotinate catabolism cluster-specific transcription factor [Erysiphe necator]|nr:Nicotinate catabolism cluster-specific transcription factor [Erysiphe necator]